MDHIETARNSILELGAEDYWHLADAAVYLPTVPEPIRQAIARDAMVQLLEEGLVELFYGQFATNEMTLVPRELAREVLNDPSAWIGEKDAKGHIYAFINTDRGDALHRSHPARSS